MDAKVLRRVVRNDRGKLEVLYYWDMEAENAREAAGKVGN